MAANDSSFLMVIGLAGAAPGLYLSLQSFTNLYRIEVMPVIYSRDGTPDNSRDERCPRI
jgi:hypothetical protein